jgi:hypothetical protein
VLPGVRRLRSALGRAANSCPSLGSLSRRSCSSPGSGAPAGSPTTWPVRLPHEYVRDVLDPRARADTGRWAGLDPGGIVHDSPRSLRRRNVSSPGRRSPRPGSHLGQLSADNDDVHVTCLEGWRLVTRQGGMCSHSGPRFRSQNGSNRAECFPHVDVGAGDVPGPPSISGCSASGRRGLPGPRAPTSGTVCPTIRLAHRACRSIHPRGIVRARLVRGAPRRHPVGR